MYEGYKSQILFKNGKLWETHVQDPTLPQSGQKLTMNVTENGKPYPIGHIFGHLAELNG